MPFLIFGRDHLQSNVWIISDPGHLRFNLRHLGIISGPGSFADPKSSCEYNPPKERSSHYYDHPLLPRGEEPI